MYTLLTAPSVLSVLSLNQTKHSVKKKDIRHFVLFCEPDEAFCKKDILYYSGYFSEGIVHVYLELQIQMIITLNQKLGLTSPPPKKTPDWCNVVYELLYK